MIPPGGYGDPTSIQVYLSTCPRKNLARLAPILAPL